MESYTTRTTYMKEKVFLSPNPQNPPESEKQKHSSVTLSIKRITFFMSEFYQASWANTSSLKERQQRN